MVPSISNSETKPVTVLNIVTHLNSEKHFPAAKDLDLGLVKAWMRALNIGLSNQAVKMLAPKVLEELLILECGCERRCHLPAASPRQARHPVKRVTPVVTHFWFGGSALPQKFMHERPKSEESVPISVPKPTSAHDRHVPPRVPGKQIKGEITHDITQDAHRDDHCETETKRFVEPINGPDVIISEEAAKELKKAKKASKKARKLIKALEKALPPVGKMDVEDEDDGEDSDWSQSSWNPSWASDEGESEEL
ncbi:hypothetical protein D6D19_07728 [Aureobasidium pullulans]|uniref:Uncharacterized protein n=1 Tax=Aureobasidium pullulans TaxID=5580 RepID=A0A4S8ZVZ3_AURPU|nr:hypothetical protein D6D19_07728 [Aureobasidium pullulans]